MYSIFGDGVHFFIFCSHCTLFISPLTQGGVVYYFSCLSGPNPTPVSELNVVDPRGSGLLQPDVEGMCRNPH